MTSANTVFPLALDELLSRFLSLGDNCEFGLVQRRAGAEPIDLLRFAGLHIPIEQRLHAVTHAISKGFEGLGREGTLLFGLGDPDQNGRREYYVQESAYSLRWHTFQYPDQIDADRLLRQQTQAVGFWRRKLLEDLRSAEKLCVWKSNLAQDETNIRQLLQALRGHGPNSLLWVMRSDAEHQAETVEDLGGGLLRGYVVRFAPYDRAGDIAFDSWFALSMRAHDVVPSLGTLERVAVDVSAYQGSVDGIIDGRVCGWCWRKGGAEPVPLELLVNGARVAVFVADTIREGLLPIGIGNGRNGFYSPAILHGLASDAVINVRVLGTDLDIPQSGRRLSEYRRFE